MRIPAGSYAVVAFTVVAALVVFLGSSGPVMAEALSTPENPKLWSILPPLLAIGVALIIRQVIPAVFIGLWLGAWLLTGATVTGIGTSFLASFQKFIISAIANPDHVAIIAFSMMISAMVALVSRNGGLQGIVALITRWADNARHVQLGTSFLGLAIFFDDYANTLLVGNTMRPVTDHHKISRQKLAYIVDSTAAPVACVALISTWVGYEVGLIDAAVEGVVGIGEPYFIFLNSILYSFYPILAILFVLMVAGTGRDFGPMLKAETAARNRVGPPEELSKEIESDLSLEISDTMPERDPPVRAINALGPIAILIIGVIAGLLATGEGDNLQEIIGSSDAYTGLLWGSLLGTTAAGLLSVTQRLMTLEEAVSVGIAGAAKIFMPLLILVLAWSLASVTEELGTANYLTATLSDTIPVEIMPVLIFLISAATAFATGSSWGVMGILTPLAVPLVAAMISTDGVINVDQLPIFYSAVASVLTGSVWGDHCSPISDTTIMSSMASGCDHIEHVRTQMPYALLVGGVAIVLGTVPVGYGMPWWLGLILGAGTLVVALKVLGRQSATA